jgi:uncharacterized protein YigE (DUF2233 family)
MWRIAAILAALAGAGDSAGVQADECRTERVVEDSFTVCSFDPGEADLRLFLNDGDGRPWGQFGRLDAELRTSGRRLDIAMNGGMYHPDRSPVGHYVEDGEELAPLVTGPGPGNFGLVPNGVLCLRPGAAEVIETARYAETRPDCRHASQSGPMLVIDGRLHPRFLRDSTSRHVRNGVGVDASGIVHMAISDRPVTFHAFARLFRDVLETPQALYLDGSVSRLWVPAIGRHDVGRPLGPILGLVRPISD